MKIAVALVLVAGTAQAGTFQPPEGCDVYLTAQMRGCTVEHYWTCEGDTPGQQWHGEITQDGLSFLGQVDGNAQWLENYYLGNDSRETLMTPVEDRQNVTNLIDEGVDTYDFRLDTLEGVQRVRGVDRIVERGVVIDGEPLLRTQYEITITDAQDAVVYASTGFEFVSERHRRFFGGYGDVTKPRAFSYDQRPVEFFYPGDPGFLDDRPKYDCDVTEARATLQGDQP